MVDAEFLAHVHAQSLLRLPPDLPRDPVRQLGVHASVTEHSG